MTYDALGRKLTETVTVEAMTDSQRNLVWSARYTAYGEATVNEDPDGDGKAITSNLRFPGQYLDAETGQHYNWHRYYDPTTGRYTQTDPIGFKAGDRYADNNPVAFIDTLGLFSIYIIDCGGRNGPLYGGTMWVTNDKGKSLKVRVSTWPDVKSKTPGIKAGSYEAVYRKKGHKGKKEGVRLRDGKEIPTRGPNPNNKGKSTATGINIHHGYNTMRGSEGCLTIHKDDASKVWDILGEEETGTVHIYRCGQ